VVGAAGSLNNLSYTGIPVTKSGYLYIWVSNETPNWDVFFDNLRVVHYSGPLLEETHYYPFGLTMEGISSKALKPNYVENWHKYNGIEYDSAFGLDEYEAFYRNLDPQIGRWWQIDPEIENGMEDQSPYASMNNNPISKSDPLGNVPGDGSDNGGGWLSKAGDYAMKGIRWINSNLNPLTPIVEVMTGKSVESDLTEDKSRVNAAVEGVMFLVPEVKVEAAVGKTVLREGEQAVVKTTEKNLTKAEERAANLSKVDRSGKDFTKAGKDAVKDVNTAKNGGQMKCQGCGQTVQKAEKHTKGVTPASNEAHVDHIQPKVKGGSGTPSNGQVLCRTCNLKKGGN
jgi:RHS repeat-associated protein